MAAKANILGLLLVSLKLGACTPEAVMPATLPPTRTVVATETGTAVAEILVTAVPITTTPTATATTTRDPNQTTDLQTLERAPSTPVPTNTPRPTFTPPPTPTLAFFDLPEWVTDPMVNVLLAGIDERSHLRLSLYNAETGERFDLPINLSSYDIPSRWTITEEGFFIELHHYIPAGSQNRLVEEINLQTGEVRQLEIPHAFIPGVQRIISPGGRYTLHIVRNENLPPQVTIIDGTNDTRIDLSGPFSNYYKDSITARWSPDSKMVAIISDHRYEDLAQPSEHALSVYSASGEPLQEYENYFSHLNWSPTSPHQLLVSRLDGDLQTPCILNFSEDAPICLERIINWRDQHEVKIHQFRWSPDGNRVSFIYWNNETMNNGLCYLDLGNDEIVCPITSEHLQNEQFVILHTWSPDGRYLVVDVNPWGPESHDGGFTSLAIVSSDGRSFQPLGDSAHVWAWRPPIPSPSGE